MPTTQGCMHALFGCIGQQQAYLLSQAHLKWHVSSDCVHKNAHSLLKAKGGSTCPPSIPDSLLDGGWGVPEARHRAALWLQAKLCDPGSSLVTTPPSVCSEVQTYAYVSVWVAQQLQYHALLHSLGRPYKLQCCALNLSAACACSHPTSYQDMIFQTANALSLAKLISMYCSRQQWWSASGVSMFHQISIERFSASICIHLLPSGAMTKLFGMNDFCSLSL